MPQYNKVAIIGAGFAGLGMAIRLKQQGETDFVILEKSSRIGGTWRDNTYPGAACDVQSHLYWFSFVEQPDWTRIYPLQAEILENIDRMAARHGLMPHVRLNTEVLSAQWDEAALRWRVQLAGGDTLEADTLISAWGQLNRPSTQSIPGIEDFAGEWFHSARWNHDVSFAGKRVASIGNGPSAAQFIPELAAVAGHLSVFQRTPNYIVPRMDRAYTDEERALFQQAAARAESRKGFYLEHEGWWAAFHPGTEESEAFRQVARAQLEMQVADPVLREKLWPNYPLGCKRLIISDDFYPALTRPNVSLITDRIERIEASGVRTQDGLLHEMDVIVYGTGFDTQQFMSVGDVVGRGGLSLRDTWREAPRAYLGMNVAGFPNFFMLYGPNTNLGHNSILLMLECQIEYVLQALQAASERGGRALDIKPAALEDFYARLQNELQTTAWAGSCQSWYKRADNLITNNWSDSVEAYKAATAQLDISRYEFVGAEA